MFILAVGYLLIAVLSIAGSLTRDKAALIRVSHVNGGRYFYVGALGRAVNVQEVRFPRGLWVPPCR